MINTPGYKTKAVPLVLEARVPLTRTMYRLSNMSVGFVRASIWTNVRASVWLNGKLRNRLMRVLMKFHSMSLNFCTREQNCSGRIYLPVGQTGRSECPSKRVRSKFGP